VERTCDVSCLGLSKACIGSGRCIPVEIRKDKHLNDCQPCCMFTRTAELHTAVQPGRLHKSLGSIASVSPLWVISTSYMNPK
jgi:hypothetical protein